MTWRDEVRTCDAATGSILRGEAQAYCSEEMPNAACGQPQEK